MTKENFNWYVMAHVLLYELLKNATIALKIISIKLQIVKQVDNKTAKKHISI